MRTAAVSTVETYLLLTNYGSFFQHYALRAVLKRLGFAPFRVADPYELLPWRVRAIDWCKDLVRPLYWKLTGFCRRETATLELRAWKRSARLFGADYRKVIGRLREPQIFGDSTIGVRGGDQVLVQDSDLRWFSAIKEGNPKITYAISTDWRKNGEDETWRRDMVSRLAKMTALGIREANGVSIVRALAPSGVPVLHVSDPVQLLTAGDFRKIQSARPVFRRPTMLCYLLNIRSEADLHLQEYESLASSLGCDLQLVGIQGVEIHAPEGRRMVLSPLRFLRALDDAEYFVTNSFHGSLFAIMYHKRFLSVRQNCPPGTDQNARQRELMSRYGLQDRWLDPSAPTAEMRDRICAPVDWTAIDAEVDRFRSESLDWLKGRVNA